jgi:hypothetical protein
MDLHHMSVSLEHDSMVLMAYETFLQVDGVYEKRSLEC